MEKILISKCLLGEYVRYDGGHNSLCEYPLIKRWLEEGRLISTCPEVQAGLSIPRVASEIIGIGGGNAVLIKKARISTKDGTDVTDIYMRGAEIALNIAKQHQIKIAILKEGSPSCGSSRIYDGSFSSIKILGEGVTAALLRKNNIHVFNENELEQVEIYLS